jgi:tRNA dimethylallyltransferase
MAEKSARIVFIAGPTGAGKSDAAIAYAERAGGEIVNADAIQVYRDLDILSARPGTQALTRVPHHLYGYLDGAVRCSAGRWARDAASFIAAAAERGRIAVVVGGTGLYFRALEEGLSPIPEVSAAVRAAARRRFEEIGREAFREDVVARDPEMAHLRASDSQRLLRAWEVHEATGQPLSAWQALPRRPLIAKPGARIVIEPERGELYRALDARFDSMLARGALGEAKRLMGRGLDPDLPVMKAVGAAELMAHLRGEIEVEAAATLAKRNTRRFAKRQLTWFRRQAASWPRFEDWRAAAAVLGR